MIPKIILTLVASVFLISCQQTNDTKLKCMFIGAADGEENAEFDQPMIEALESWGFEVVDHVSSDIASFTASDYEPYDFIFLSETTHSSHMSPLRKALKPMVCSDGWGAKESSLGYGKGEPVGIHEPAVPVVILESAGSHALAAGIPSGTVFNIATVEDEANPALLVWGMPSIPVVAIAGVAADPTQLVVYGIEKGTTNVVGDEIENRVAVVSPHAWSYDDLTEEGAKLYQAAIAWIVEGK